MQISFRDLLRMSLRYIGDERVGVRPSASKLNDGLLTLNVFLDQLNIDPNASDFTLVQLFNLTASKQAYLWGPSGQVDWVGPRPNRIIDANLIILTNPQQPLRRPIRILNDDEFSAIKLLGVATTIPEYGYINQTYPVASFQLWPIPTANYKIEFYTDAAKPFIPNVDSSVDFPPGWAELLATNWAIRLGPQWMENLSDRARQLWYGGKRQEIAELASRALMMVQNQNSDTPQMELDDGIFGPMQTRKGDYFNRLTGDIE